jgi:hypothetical protein
MEQYMVSCGDGRSCVIGSNDGYLAWMHATRSGHIGIRVQAVPSRWGTNVLAVGCATGIDCFVETAGGSEGAQLDATRDEGRTWTSALLAPDAPQDTAVYMSCPVAAGCVALANDGTGSQSSWVVLSNLHIHG